MPKALQPRSRAAGENVGLEGPGLPWGWHMRGGRYIWEQTVSRGGEGGEWDLQALDMRDLTQPPHPPACSLAAEAPPSLP